MKHYPACKELSKIFHVFLVESPKKESVVVNDDANADDDDDIDGNTENLYQVPPPAKSVEDLPRKYIKTVCITVTGYIGRSICVWF